MVPPSFTQLCFATALAVASLMGCEPHAQPAQPPLTKAPLVEPPRPTWVHVKTATTLDADTSSWVLTEPEGLTLGEGVDVKIGLRCAGRIRVQPLTDASQGERAEALSRRMHQSLVEMAVSEVDVADQGEVPHGTYRAYMMRVSGQRAGRSWFARMVSTFMTRDGERFYVEMVASSEASSSVARRGCFDRVIKAVTNPKEVR